MTNRTAATRYARALLDVLVAEHGDLEKVEHDLDGFIALFTAHPTLAKVLTNPAVPVARKQAAVVELTTRQGTSSVLAKLLALLAERDRLALLADILASYRERMLDHQKVVRAQVTTATPLPAARAEALERRLATLTGRTVTLATTVDPSIIGGVIARIGSTVYDGSVTTQLAKMKRKLVDASEF
jgi:F-type H+-transporting ATPase subunit delta